MSTRSESEDSTLRSEARSKRLNSFLVAFRTYHGQHDNEHVGECDWSAMGETSDVVPTVTDLSIINHIGAASSCGYLSSTACKARTHDREMAGPIGRVGLVRMQLKSTSPGFAT
jgi:hypothetical protein